MKMTINKKARMISAEENNNMLALGFIYKVESNYYVCGTDSWSGMDDYNNDTTFFTTEEEAIEYVNTVKDAKSIEKVVRMLTREEIKAREEAREKAEAEKKLAKEKAKADAVGMNVEDYKEYKRLERNKKRHINELEKARRQVEIWKEQIKYEEKRIAEYEAEMKKYEK